MGRAFVGLGANLGDRSATLHARDRAARRARRGSRSSRCRRFARPTPSASSTSRGSSTRAVAIETTLAPEALLAELLDVERELGRTRDGPRFGPRTVDLDLLLLEGVTVDEPGLTVPHPRLHERAFALAPLVELDPSLVVPGHGTVAQSSSAD